MEEIIHTAGWHIKNMMQDNLLGLHISPVNVIRNGSRAFGIDKAGVCCLDLILSLRHGVKGLNEVTIAGDVICYTSVKNPIIVRSVCQCQVDRDHGVWCRVGDSVRMYDRDDE
jgi:hypothetical protein